MDLGKKCCRCGRVIGTAKVLYKSAHDGKSPLCGICSFDEKVEIMNGVKPKSVYWDNRVITVGESNG